jgi:phospholipid transport system substrate-binding protein
LTLIGLFFNPSYAFTLKGPFFYDLDLPMKKTLLSLCCALLLTVSSWPALAGAEEVAKATPSALVKSYYHALSDTMKQGETLGFEGRYKKLDPAVRAAFNLPFMARFAVGPAWSKASEAEQKNIVEAFSAFSVATYASRFKKDDGERFDVVDEKPAAGGGVVVETKLTPKDSDPVTLNYLVRDDETGAPRIVDVYLDASISELATRRSEFGAVIKREGLPALITMLSDKSKKMGTP